jgi:hypothetical protein
LKLLVEQGHLFPLPASQLIRRARAEAEKNAKAANISFEYWPVAGEAMLELLISAGALIDEQGAPISSGFHARGTSVGELKKGFENDCELYLLKFLISKTGDITKHDRTSLAHALFKVSRSEKTLDEMLDRVDELFWMLQDEIVEDSDGRLQLKNGTESLSKAVAASP